MKNLFTLGLLSLLLAAPSAFASKTTDTAIKTALGTGLGLTTATLRGVIGYSLIPCIIRTLLGVGEDDVISKKEFVLFLTLQAGNLYGSEILREKLAKALDKEATDKTETNTGLINKSSRATSGMLTSLQAVSYYTGHDIKTLILEAIWGTD